MWDGGRHYRKPRAWVENATSELSKGDESLLLIYIDKTSTVQEHSLQEVGRKEKEGYVPKRHSFHNSCLLDGFKRIWRRIPFYPIQHSQFTSSKPAIAKPIFPLDDDLSFESSRFLTKKIKRQGSYTANSGFPFKKPKGMVEVELSPVKKRPRFESVELWSYLVMKIMWSGGVLGVWELRG